MDATTALLAAIFDSFPSGSERTIILLLLPSTRGNIVARVDREKGPVVPLRGRCIIHLYSFFGSRRFLNDFFVVSKLSLANSSSLFLQAGIIKRVGGSFFGRLVERRAVGEGRKKIEIHVQTREAWREKKNGRLNAVIARYLACRCSFVPPTLFPMGAKQLSAGRRTPDPMSIYPPLHSTRFDRFSPVMFVHSVRVNDERRTRSRSTRYGYPVFSTLLTRAEKPTLNDLSPRTFSVRSRLFDYNNILLLLPVPTRHDLFVKIIFCRMPSWSSLSSSNWNCHFFPIFFRIIYKFFTNLRWKISSI